MRLPSDEAVIAGLNRLPGPLLGLIAGVAYFASTFLNDALAFTPEQIPVLSVAAGVAVYLTLSVARPPAWVWIGIGVYLGQVGGELVQGRDLPVALGFGLATIPFVAFGIELRRQGLYERGVVSREEDMRATMARTAIASVASALVAVVVVATQGYGDYLTFFLSWATSVFLGVSLVAPLGVPHYGRGLHAMQARLSDRPWPIFLALAAVELVLIAVLFGVGAIDTGPASLAGTFVVLPVVVFATRWLGPRMVGALFLIAIVEISLITAAGVGPFAEFTDTTADALYAAQITLVLLLATTGIFAVTQVELRAAGARFSALFEDAPGLAIVAQPSADGGVTLTDCNRAFLEAIGRERADVVGRPISEVIPECSAVEFTPEDFRLAAGHQLTPEERELAVAAGKTIPVLMEAGPYLDDTGNIAGLQATYLDLTDRKRAEELERENQLIQQQRLATLGRLTAGIAHEVKNPLNFVVNFAEANTELTDAARELLGPKTEQLGPDAAEIEEILDDLGHNAGAIRNHSQRALDIMMSMLQLSRPDSAEPVPCDLNVLADRYAKLAYHGLRARGREVNAEVELELDSELPRVPAVEADVGRVILNLVGNACEAASERAEGGGGERPMVTVSTRATASAVELRVADNGTGISGDALARVFEPFFTTKDPGEGTGLGLSIAKEIVDKHHGSIDVSSEPGTGTEFTVTLPRDGAD